MEYPLPGPVIALLSQERAALAPKSYLISSCKKSIKITLVYAKDQEVPEELAAGATAATVATATATSAAATAATRAGASTSRASSVSSLLSSSSSLSSSTERKKPRHANGSGKQSRKKKRKNKSSRKTSRSSSRNMALPRVSKLSESSLSPSSGPDVAGPKGNAGNGGGRGGIPSRRQNDTLEKGGEDSCSTPEFPLLFGDPHHRDGISRERMSTVDSGVPSSNGTMAYEQTAESAASDEDQGVRDIREMENTKRGSGRRQDKLVPRLARERGQTIKPSQKHGESGTPERKEGEGGRVRSLPVELPRRTAGISESSFSSLSSSDENEPKMKTVDGGSAREVKKTTESSAGSLASMPQLAIGAQTPARGEEKWQTWTRIPRTQSASTSSRQKLMAAPTVAPRLSNSQSTSGSAEGVAHRSSAQTNPDGPATSGTANQNKGASWDGSDNL